MGIAQQMLVINSARGQTKNLSDKNTTCRALVATHFTANSITTDLNEPYRRAKTR